MPDYCRTPVSVVLTTIALVILLANACAHRKPAASPEALGAACETYHRLARWGDYRGAAQLVLPEHRLEYLKKIIDSKFEENLKITDYEPLDAQRGEEKAVVLSKVTWHLLPSVTTRSETETLSWEAREGIWYISSIAGGPLTLK